MINKCGFLILVKNYIFITIAKKNLSNDFFFFIRTCCFSKFYNRIWFRIFGGLVEFLHRFKLEMAICQIKLLPKLVFLRKSIFSIVRTFSLNWRNHLNWNSCRTMSEDENYNNKSQLYLCIFWFRNDLSLLKSVLIQICHF